MFQQKKMKQKNKFLLSFSLLLMPFMALAQADSISKLSLNNFMSMVKKNHPVAKQADLLLKSAAANELAARGAFDPKLFYDFNNKFYESENYYALGNGGFKIPTWFGVELKGGFENNDGSYLNPENNLPDDGLIYAQISLPVLQGLIIDERRATLKQAKVFQDLSQIEKINILNKLLYDAGKVYWDWTLAYNNLQVYSNAVSISEERFKAMVKTSALGDRPAIDTVEANIQLQERIISQQQARMDYRTKSLLMSNFLWLENDVPIELTENTMPESNNMSNENLLDVNVNEIDSLINIHPELRVYEFKLQQLSIEEKFKQDKLKPLVNLNYNPLFNSENKNSNYFDNYKWGVTVGFPVFLRKERGNLQMTRIKIMDNNFETINKRNELINKTKTTINEYNNYKTQIDIYTKNVNNYERLWQSEKRLFESGESSLFMINSREMSYINAQVKLNDLINKNQKAALDAEFSFGQLNSKY